MFTSGNLSLLAMAVAVVGIAFFIASSSRAKRIAAERPRDVTPAEKREK